MSYWRTTEFWMKARESFSFYGIIGTGGVSGMDATNLAHIEAKYIAYISGVALAGAVFSHFTKIWFEDKDGDGTIDILQKKKKI